MISIFKVGANLYLMSRLLMITVYKDTFSIFVGIFLCFIDHTDDVLRYSFT